MRPLRLAALVLLAAPAFAAGPQPGDAPIPPEEWRAMVEGRTVWYSLNGEHWGREYFHPDKDSATFLARDGQCVTAPWAYAEGVYCFAYAGMHCFRHVRRDGEIVVIPIEGDGAEQRVERIDDTPISCEPPLSS